LSIACQCELLGLSRSTCYYQPRGETAENLALMRRIDEQYLKTPFYGSRKLTQLLGVNRKRIQRLMRQMGIEAIYAKKRTTWPGEGHRIYPYLLRNMAIRSPDQVWSTDITYLPMQQGFLYLVAVIDWYSRRVLSWRLSNTLTLSFCLEALEEALADKQPEIFNTDQGSQFYVHSIYRSPCDSRHCDQHGWPWSCHRQRVCRAALAKCEVRRGVLEKLCRRLGSGGQLARVFSILQSRTDSPSTRLPHTSRSL